MGPDGSGLFYIIPTGSMDDTLLVGDHIVVLPVWDSSSVERMDIVVLVYLIDASQVFIKRVVGRPGDRIRMVDKQLFVNGEPLEEP